MQKASKISAARRGVHSLSIERGAVEPKRKYHVFCALLRQSFALKRGRKICLKHLLKNLFSGANLSRI